MEGKKRKDVNRSGPAGDLWGRQKERKNENKRNKVETLTAIRNEAARVVALYNQIKIKLNGTSANQASAATDVMNLVGVNTRPSDDILLELWEIIPPSGTKNALWNMPAVNSIRKSLAPWIVDIKRRGAVDKKNAAIVEDKAVVAVFKAAKAKEKAATKLQAEADKIELDNYKAAVAKSRAEADEKNADTSMLERDKSISKADEEEDAPSSGPRPSRSPVLHKVSSSSSIVKALTSLFGYYATDYFNSWENERERAVSYIMNSPFSSSLWQKENDLRNTYGYIGEGSYGVILTDGDVAIKCQRLNTRHGSKKYTGKINEVVTELVIQRLMFQNWSTLSKMSESPVHYPFAEIYPWLEIGDKIQAILPELLPLKKRQFYKEQFGDKGRIEKKIMGDKDKIVYTVDGVEKQRAWLNSNTLRNTTCVRFQRLADINSGDDSEEKITDVRTLVSMHKYATIKIKKWRYNYKKLVKERLFSAAYQISCILRYAKDHNMHFMHMDLHTENIMQHLESQPICIALDDKNQFTRAVIGEGISVGKPVTMIDFGMSSIIIAGERINSSATAYPYDPRYHNYDKLPLYDSQHDLRLLFTSMYDDLCIDPATQVELSINQLTQFGQFVCDVVHKAQVQSVRYRLSTNIGLLARIGSTIREISVWNLTGKSSSDRTKFVGHEKQDSENQFFKMIYNEKLWRMLLCEAESIEHLTLTLKPIIQYHRDKYMTFYNETIHGEDQLKLVLDIVKAHFGSWRLVWTGEQHRVPLQHFQYGGALGLEETSIFEPENMMKELQKHYNKVTQTWG